MGTTNGVNKRTTALHITGRDNSHCGLQGMGTLGQEGIPIESCSIVTAEANTDVAAIHHRMPVMLGLDEVDNWINGGDNEAKSLLKRPAPRQLGASQSAPLSTIHETKASAPSRLSQQLTTRGRTPMDDEAGHLTASIPSGDHGQSVTGLHDENYRYRWLESADGIVLALSTNPDRRVVTAVHRWMLWPALFISRPHRALCLGLVAGSLPRFLSPWCERTVLTMTRMLSIGPAHFNLPATVSAYAADARDAARGANTWFRLGSMRRLDSMGVPDWLGNIAFQDAARRRETWRRGRGQRVSARPGHCAACVAHDGQPMGRSWTWRSPNNLVIAAFSTRYQRSGEALWMTGQQHLKSRLTYRFHRWPMRYITATARAGSCGFSRRRASDFCLGNLLHETS